MWSRVELKTSAKQILQKNYWGAVVVALVMAIAIGDIGIGSVINIDRFQDNYTSSQISTGVIQDGFGNDFSYEGYGYYKQFAQKIIDMVNSLSYTKILIILILSLVIMLAAIVVSAFVLAPLEVGCRKWMLKNRTDNPPYGEMAAGFSQGYLNIVKIMFCRNLFIGLWSLLFVIPGIVKAYEYRMIPYLLAENPNMSMSEAFGRSRNMMHNNKMNAFVLDLSFIGWYILVAFSCGIVAIFYVLPYVYLTDTELYVALCRTPNNVNQNENSAGQYDSSNEQYDSYHEV